MGITDRGVPDTRKRADNICPLFCYKESQITCKSFTNACNCATFVVLYNQRKVICMATKTANFNMRVDEDKKNSVEQLYQKLGMTLPQAVNMFFSQSLLVGGLPFDVKLPRYNEETEEAMREAIQLTNDPATKRYATFADAVKDIDD